MTDSEQQLYYDMYSAMLWKDRFELERIHDDSFVLTHMTGMQQNKQDYVESIMNGASNYYSADKKHFKIQVVGDTAEMTSQNLVNASVFGSGRQTWPL